MKKVTIALENFETVSESHGNKLVGGFSQIFSIQKETFSTASVNNCPVNNGNCIPDCRGDGGGSNSGNCQCTVVA